MHFAAIITLTANDSMHVSTHNSIHLFLFHVSSESCSTCFANSRSHSASKRRKVTDLGRPAHTSADPAGDVCVLSPWTAWPALASPPVPSTAKVKGLCGVGSNSVHHSWRMRNTQVCIKRYKKNHNSTVLYLKKIQLYCKMVPLEVTFLFGLLLHFTIFNY